MLSKKNIHKEKNDINYMDIESNDDEWIELMNSISSDTEEIDSINLNNITVKSFNSDNTYINIDLEKKIDICNIITENICEKCNINCKTLNGIIYANYVEWRIKLNLII